MAARDAELPGPLLSQVDPSTIGQTEEPTLLAYDLTGSSSMPLLPAPSARVWMNNTSEHFANRCLPMLVANQSGWVLLNPHAFFAKWTGGNDRASLAVFYPKGGGPTAAVSHFGYGILSWNIPYLFRTPPGYNLLVRGPANWPKDGIAPLEGVVETDWAEATFTMNWQLTRPNVVVSFSVGEPICMVVPQRRGELEAWQPEVRDIDSAPELATGFAAFMQRRVEAIRQVHYADDRSEDLTNFWQRDYVRGITPSGNRAVQHQMKLKLRRFVDRRANVGRGMDE